MCKKCYFLRRLSQILCRVFSQCLFQFNLGLLVLSTLFKFSHIETAVNPGCFIFWIFTSLQLQLHMYYSFFYRWNMRKLQNCYSMSTFRWSHVGVPLVDAMTVTLWSLRDSENAASWQYLMLACRALCDLLYYSQSVHCHHPSSAAAAAAAAVAIATRHSRFG